MMLFYNLRVRLMYAIKHYLLTYSYLLTHTYIQCGS